MHEKIAIDEVEPRDIEGLDPTLRAVGYQLQPDEMRPNVWEYEEGESNNRHYQETQEELYLVLSGRFRMWVEDEAFELAPNDLVVVPPEAKRQLRALEDSRLFVVGAPNVKDDGVVVDED